MRKRIIGQGTAAGSSVEGRWLDVAQLAQVEITSEDPAHPIEAALTQGTGDGWRAAEPGPQTIRLLFDTPLSLGRIRLVFDDATVARTQEFSLHWSPDAGQSYQEILRQQYTFSPTGTTREVEDYSVTLAGVTALELRIVPEIGGGPARAALTLLQLAAL